MVFQITLLLLFGFGVALIKGVAAFFYENTPERSHPSGCDMNGVI